MHHTTRIPNISENRIFCFEKLQRKDTKSRKSINFTKRKTSHFRPHYLRGAPSGLVWALLSLRRPLRLKIGTFRPVMGSPRHENCLFSLNLTLKGCSTSSANSSNRKWAPGIGEGSEISPPPPPAAPLSAFLFSRSPQNRDGWKAFMIGCPLVDVIKLKNGGYRKKS